METKVGINREKCINSLHMVGNMLYALSGNENELSIYKRILHIMNRLLRFNNLNEEQYYIIYVWFKDQGYKTPWNNDGLSYQLLNCLSINLPHLLLNNIDHDEEIRKCFCEEITNNIDEEIKLILEVK